METSASSKVMLQTIKLPALVPDAILRMKRHCPHTDAVLGAMILCENAKIPWRVLPDTSMTLETLQKYDLLLLPEVYIISDLLLALLKEYISLGGKVITSMESGLWERKWYKKSKLCVIKALWSKLCYYSQRISPKYLVCLFSTSK